MRLNSDSHLTEMLGFFSLNEEPLKIMKTLFYLLKKVFLFLRFLNFYSDFSSDTRKNPRLFLKFLESKEHVTSSTD